MTVRTVVSAPHRVEEANVDLPVLLPLAAATTLRAKMIDGTVTVVIEVTEIETEITMTAAAPAALRIETVTEIGT